LGFKNKILKKARKDLAQNAVVEERCVLTNENEQVRKLPYDF